MPKLFKTTREKVRKFESFNQARNYLVKLGFKQYEDDHEVYTFECEVSEEYWGALIHPHYADYRKDVILQIWWTGDY